MSKNEYQREQFPVGTIVEAIIPIGRGPMSDPFPVGTRGKVTSHCDDGRAWVFFDGEGHTFHEIEKFVRMVQTAKEVDEHQPAARGGDDDNEHSPLPWRTGGPYSEFVVSNVGNEPSVARATGLTRKEAEANARFIVECVNQHQSLVAERERWERLKSKIAWHRDGVGPDVPVLQERYDKLIKERNELRAEQEQLRQIIRDEITAIRIWQHAIHPRSDVQEGLSISLSKLESALNEQRSTSE